MNLQRDDVFVYLIDLPDGINEMITPCTDGHTVYIDARLDDAHRLRAYEHACSHIDGNDFEKSNIQQIEADAHRKGTEKLYAPEKPSATQSEKRWADAAERNRIRRENILKELEECRRDIESLMKDDSRFRDDHTLI